MMSKRYGLVWHRADWDLPATRVEAWEADGETYEMLLSDPVLVCDAYGNMQIARYEEDAGIGLRGFVEDGGCVLDGVTHWRQLPDPPEGCHA